MLTRWVCTSTHSCDDISDYLDSRPSRCWKFSSIRLIESFIFLSRLGGLQRRTQEMWTGWVQSLKSFFLTDQIDPPPSAAPIALITSCSDNKSVKCQNRAAVKKKKNLLPTRRENQDECLRLNHQDRQLRRFTELDIAFSNFTVCSVWSAATSLICRRHFVSVCGPASRWALWNPAELFHHFHQSNIVCSHLCRCEHRFFTFQHFTSDLLPEIPSQTRNVSPRRVTSWCLCKLLIRQRAVLRSNSLTFTALS